MIHTMTAPRIYYVHPLLLGRLEADAPEDGPGGWRAACRRARDLGCSHLLTAPPWRSASGTGVFTPDDPDRPDPAFDDADELTDGLRRLAALCEAQGLHLLMDLRLDRAAADGALARAHPDWFHPAPPAGEAFDPRRAPHERDVLELQRGDDGRAPAGFVSAWVDRLSAWAVAGVAGFRCDAPQRLAATDWQGIIGHVRVRCPHCLFLAWTPGATPAEIAALRGTGFGAVFSSLPWWDYRSAWLAEEDQRLRAVAPVIACVEPPFGKRAADALAPVPLRQRQALRALWTAAAIGDGLLIPMGFECGATEPMEAARGNAADGARLLRAPYEGLVAALSDASRWLEGAGAGPLHCLTGADAPCTVLFRGDGRPYQTPASPSAPARVLAVNPDPHAPAAPDWDAVRARLPESYAALQPARDAGRGATRPDGALAALLEPAGCMALTALRTDPVTTGPVTQEGRRKALAAALHAPRVVIENVAPAIDGGRFPLKRTLGQQVRVEADIFMDGHDRIGAALLHRAADESEWRRLPLEALPNDRWQGTFAPTRIGKHYYTVQAWRDAWATYREELRKKHEAGLDLTLEVEEGRALLAGTRERLDGDRHVETARTLDRLLRALGPPLPPPGKRRGAPARAGAVLGPATPEQVELLLGEETARTMRAAGEYPFETRHEPLCVCVERPAAGFASWYELFPRSQSGDPDRHGTFDDVAARLPAIREMGFDVLYFPPIHPIGVSNRKGRNNSLRAGPRDPGSPYAIGDGSGGHEAVHPQLGTLEDFQRLIGLAREHGLEIALDFAIQCSPDHPWLAQHPEWFAWRPDGSLRYAENPPKKYEDIVNVDFYSTRGGAVRQAALWRTLRDVVLFWVEHGVRMFRVDNPHTKPLAFWEWLIADVQGRHPETLFLSEAFTRPKMMYRLAKLGFSQSYTYFTWRETKRELTEYLTEISCSPVADFFRPHFFVNTPDINPRFLQASGRPGFLIRAALAATGSGLWGMYSGFELCEANALPGKEEYLNSEKYEIRAWDWQRPGNIVAEISRLNRIRRTNPALHSHRGLRFHPAHNDRVLFFSKATETRDNVLLVAISLDPHQAQSAAVELPLWEFGLPDDGTLHAEDLLHSYRLAWHGKSQRLDFSPDQPYGIWRVSARP